MENLAARVGLARWAFTVRLAPWQNPLGEPVLGMTPEGYDKAIPKVLPAALELAKEGVRLAALNGRVRGFGSVLANG